MDFLTLTFDFSKQRVYPIEISLTEVITQDNFIIDAFGPTKPPESYYEYTREPSFVSYYDPTMVNSIMITARPDKKTISRRVYMFWDLMNDVGGFFSSLQIIFMCIWPCVKVWSLEQYLIKKLYRTQSCVADIDVQS